MYFPCSGGVVRQVLVLALVVLAIGGLAGCSFSGTAAPTATPPPTATSVPATMAVTATAAQVAVVTPSVATSLPTATATGLPTATVMATATMRPTVTASPTIRLATPGTPGTPASAGATPGTAQLVLRDAQQACELTLPVGFDQNVSSSPNDSYIADRGVLRISLQSLTVGQDEAFDDQTLPFVGAFIPTVEGYQQTSVIRLADSLRIDFRGQMSLPGSGVLYFQQFGSTICAMTVFAADASGVNVDSLLEKLIPTLRPKGVG
jgi:hypothetical protein